METEAVETGEGEEQLTPPHLLCTETRSLSTYCCDRPQARILITVKLGMVVSGGGKTCTCSCMLREGGAEVRQENRNLQVHPQQCAELRRKSG